MTDIINGSKCKCGTISIPPVEHCSRCNLKPGTIDIDPQGKVLTFTLLHVTATGFDSPLGIALVELQDGIKVMCNYDPDIDINIGNAVRLVIDKKTLYIVN